MRISIIVAMADGGVIGEKGDLPWRLPADLKRFRSLTMGHHVLMGRRTFESVVRLPGRTLVVLTRNPDTLPAGVPGASTLEEALALAESAGDSEVFIAGGTEVFREALPVAHRIYLTRIHARIPGDTRFPRLDESSWKAISQETFPPEASHHATHHATHHASHAHAFSFVTLVRVQRRA